MAAHNKVNVIFRPRDVQNGHKPKRPQPKRPLTKTATN